MNPHTKQTHTLSSSTKGASACYGVGVNYQKGQSLIELLIAMAILILTISAISFLILDSYIAHRAGREETIATFLAEEGLEVARSIRDNDWADLIDGSHGIAISGDSWIFQGTEEDVSGQLSEGKRKVVVSSVNTDRKKVQSQITWEFSEARSQEVILVTYLTNWQKGLEIRRPTDHTDFAERTKENDKAYDYPDGTTFATTKYDFSADPSITFHSWESSTQTYTSLVLKYRYYADESIDDTYAVAYSITGCTGTFIDLVFPTSDGASDTTVSVELSSVQDLVQLCVKIYTEKIGKGDKKEIYTRDIWTEGTY